MVSYSRSSANSLGKLHTDFHHGFMSFHAHYQWISTPSIFISMLVFVCVFIWLLTLTAMILIIEVDLIYDSQMIKDVVYFKNDSQVIVALQNSVFYH